MAPIDTGYQAVSGVLCETRALASAVARRRGPACRRTASPTPQGRARRNSRQGRAQASVCSESVAQCSSVCPLFVSLGQPSWSLRQQVRRSARAHTNGHACARAERPREVQAPQGRPGGVGPSEHSDLRRLPLAESVPPSLWLTHHTAESLALLASSSYRRAEALERRGVQCRAAAVQERNERPSYSWSPPARPLESFGLSNGKPC